MPEPVQLDHPKRLLIGGVLIGLGAMMCYARMHVEALTMWDALVCLAPVLWGLFLIDPDDVKAILTAILPFAKRDD